MAQDHASVMGTLAQGVTSIFSAPGSDSILSGVPRRKDPGIQMDNTPAHQTGIASILNGPEGMA